jgi:hypothetical protein
MLFGSRRFYALAVGKIAIDPGFGHYEALGVLRVLSDRVVPTAGHAAATARSAAGWGQTPTSGCSAGLTCWATC